MKTQLKGNIINFFLQDLNFCHINTLKRVPKKFLHDVQLQHDVTGHNDFFTELIFHNLRDVMDLN